MNIFDQLKTGIQENSDTLHQFFQKLESIVEESKSKRLGDFIKKNKEKLSKNVSALEGHVNDLYPAFEKELSKKTSRLKQKIAEIERAKETVASDNFILEFKKKDLLKLTTDLEDAYDEISKRTEELKEAHAQILEKNRELELGKEALLDQADYLHEANETISRMHDEVRQQREEILRKNEELLNINNEKNNLISIVAHDLKSPLNQIKGLISLVKVSSENLGHETTQYIDLMESSVTKLTNMIGKILDVEAIESRELNLKIEPIRISDLLKEIVGRFKNEATQKNITLNENIGSGLIALADKDYADQVFQNLISNAIKFSPKNKNVYISLINTQGKVIGEIRDEGPGISEQDKKKLFGKYQKLSAKPTGNETSTGLGLSIVKKFVESMKGEIWCESEVGHGATFFVAFPEENNSL